MEPKVSVILPVYNGAEFVERTIESILHQTYDNLEIFIIDDASGDASREKIEQYHDERITKIFHDKNKSVCVSSNQAFSKCTGEYIALIGHDDIWKPEKIKKQVEFLESHKNVGVCFSRCDIIDENEQIVNSLFPDLYRVFQTPNRSQERWIRTLVFGGNKFCAPSAVIRKSIIGEEMLYHNAYLQEQDFELWVRLVQKAEIHIMEEKLVNYRRFVQKHTNLSSIDDTMRRRVMHEVWCIQKEFVFGLSDEALRRFCGSRFGNKESAAKEELWCERLWILKQIKNPLIMELLSDAMNQEIYRNILEEKFGFSIQSFYQYTGERLSLEV